MNRLDFLGLNSNEAACVLLYLMAALWVLNLAARRVYARVGLIIMEAVLVVLVARTMSRGAVVALVCGLVYMWFKWHGLAVRAMAAGCSAANWVSCSLVWRLLLLLSSPGLWARSAPAYVVQDASIGNRLALWKGAVKLIATAPLGGWGYTRTGASYMNWFGSVLKVQQKGDSW